MDKTIGQRIRNSASSTMERNFVTEVTTIVGNDRNVYQHVHASRDDVRVNVNNDQCLEIVLEMNKQYVSYPLTNVEKFTTKPWRGV